MDEGSIRPAASNLSAMYFLKAKSWAGVIVEGWSVLATCRQEASSLAGDEGCRLTTNKCGGGNSIPGAMLLQMACKSGAHVHHISHANRVASLGLTRRSGRTTMRTTEQGRRQTDRDGATHYTL